MISGRRLKSRVAACSLAVTVMLTLCGSAAAQKRAGEEAEYRARLASTIGEKAVAEAQAETLPAGTPLRVYVLAPSQEEIVYSFMEWAESWNRGEGMKYGRVHIVGDASRADVILARFLTPFKKKEYPPPGEERWTAMGSVDGRAGPSPAMIPPAMAQLPAATVTHSAKVYSYIAAREADGLKLLWRGDDTVRVKGRRPTPDFQLGLLKGNKDSKVAGDSLLNRFFKMLLARVQPHY